MPEMKLNSFKTTELNLLFSSLPWNLFFHNNNMCLFELKIRLQICFNKNKIIEKIKQNENNININ